MEGVALAVLATTMFALITPYVTLLTPLSGSDIFAWRMIWTLPATLLVVAVRRNFGALLALVREIQCEPLTGLNLMSCAALLGLQQWLFLWAPLHGHMLDVSMGYFLLPIIMVIVGRAIDAQRVHRLQWLAVAFACIGVANELTSLSKSSWPTLVVALGFPPYFILRRRLKHDSLTIFVGELVAILPVAVMFAATSGTFDVASGDPYLVGLLLPGLGLLTAASFLCYLTASRMLPMGLFGLLGFIEPILLVVISVLVLGERIGAHGLWTYIPIGLSVATTTAYVFRSSMKISFRASLR